MAVVTRKLAIWRSFCGAILSTVAVHQCYINFIPFCQQNSVLVFSLLFSILQPELWKWWAWGTAWDVKRRFVIGADVNMALIQFLLRFKTVVITTRRLIISLFLWESGVEFEFHCKATPALFIISSLTASSLLRSWHCHWPERALTYTQYVGAKGKKRSQTQLEPID